MATKKTTPAKARKKTTPKPTVVIDIYDGLISSIRGIPEGVVVEVRNYDTEMADHHELTQDEHGEWYLRSLWKGQG